MMERKGHTAIVRRISWSPDGARLATGGNDNTVKIWTTPFYADYNFTIHPDAKAAFGDDFFEKVQQALSEMSKKVQQAMQQSPGPGTEQLTQMLGQTLQDLENAQQAGEKGQGEQQKASEQAEANLKGNAEASGDSGFVDFLSE